MEKQSDKTKHILEGKKSHKSLKDFEYVNLKTKHDVIKPLGPDPMKLRNGSLKVCGSSCGEFTSFFSSSHLIEGQDQSLFSASHFPYKHVFLV